MPPYFFPPWTRADLADAVAFDHWLKAHKPTLWHLTPAENRLLLYSLAMELWRNSQQQLVTWLEAQQVDMQTQTDWERHLQVISPEVEASRQRLLEMILRQIKEWRWNPANTTIPLWEQEQEEKYRLELDLEND